MAERDPQISFRVKPEVQAKLTELANGQTMYAYMPGFVDDALNDLATLRGTMAESYKRTGEQEGIINRLKDENARLTNEISERETELVAIKTERERLLAKFGKQNEETAEIRLKNIELTTQLGAAEARLKRVIDKAVKNSFVSRKEYEKI